MIQFCQGFRFQTWYSCYTNIELFNVEKFVLIFCFRKILVLKSGHASKTDALLSQMSGCRPVQRSFRILMTCIGFLGSSRLHFIPKRELWIEHLEEKLPFWRKIAEIACLLSFTKRFDPKILHLLRLHVCLRCNFSYASLEKLAICL